jgi:hypothetical protein
VHALFAQAMRLREQRRHRVRPAPGRVGLPGYPERLLFFLLMFSGPREA